MDTDEPEPDGNIYYYSAFEKTQHCFRVLPEFKKNDVVIIDLDLAEDSQIDLPKEELIDIIFSDDAKRIGCKIEFKENKCIFVVR